MTITMINMITSITLVVEKGIKDISRGLADSGAVNQNPGPESATSWLFPDPESANPQVSGLSL